jgi:hypothetical protein
MGSVTSASALGEEETDDGIVIAQDLARARATLTPKATPRPTPRKPLLPIPVAEAMPPSPAHEPPAPGHAPRTPPHAPTTLPPAVPPAPLPPPGHAPVTPTQEPAPQPPPPTPQEQEDEAHESQIKRRRLERHTSNPQNNSSTEAFDYRGITVSRYDRPGKRFWQCQGLPGEKRWAGTKSKSSGFVLPDDPDAATCRSELVLILLITAYDT